MQIIRMVEKEKIPLAIIYKQNGKLWLEGSPDCNDFELFGFLKTYVVYLEEILVDSFESFDGED